MGKLSIDRLSKSFGDTVAVNNISFEVNQGELVTIVGPSGCGKTTLLRMIAGFSEPTNGRITLDDRVLFDNNKRKEVIKPEFRDMGMVFQSYAIWSHMNVFDNVAYPLKIRKVNKNEIRDKVKAILAVMRLEEFKHRMSSELSGGQQQRVALARSLIMNPRLLLLDEPLSNLDAALRDEMRGEIKEIQRKMGITIINVTHDQIEALTMSDRIVLMKDGDIVQYDTPENMYNHPENTFVAKFIGMSNILEAKIVKKDVETRKMTVEVVKGHFIDLPLIKGANDSGYIAIRPNNFEVSQDEGLPVTVKQRLYMGNMVECRVEFENTKKVRFYSERMMKFEVGQVVNLKIKKAIWLNE